MKLLVIQFLMLDDFSHGEKKVMLMFAVLFLFEIFRHCSNRGRRKASEAFASSGGELKHTIYSRKEVDEGLYSFLFNEIEEPNIDKEWVKHFLKVCHWCGYQVLVRKDSDMDIEEKTSMACDAEIVNKLEEINEPIFSEAVVNFYKKKNSKDELK